MFIGDNRYKIQSLINRGSFGEVFEAVDKETKEVVAIKIEDSGKDSYLLFESYVYRKVDSNLHFPRFYEFGVFKGGHYIVLERVNNSLESFFDKN